MATGPIPPSTLRSCTCAWSGAQSPDRQHLRAEVPSCSRSVASYNPVGVSPSVPQEGQARAGPSSVEMVSEGQGEKGLAALKIGDEIITLMLVSLHQDLAFHGDWCRGTWGSQASQGHRPGDPIPSPRDLAASPWGPDLAYLVGVTIQDRALCTLGVPFCPACHPSASAPAPGHLPDPTVSSQRPPACLPWPVLPRLRAREERFQSGRRSRTRGHAYTRWPDFIPFPRAVPHLQTLRDRTS